jgi:L-arabinose isomerase
MGLLLLGAERFCSLGEGTKRGTYLKRKQDEASWMLAGCQKIADVTFPGIVFNREDIISAMDAFISGKVDYVLAIYLSWAEDFAWNRFLRDMPPVPVLFAHRMRDEINLKDTHDSDEFTEYLCCGGLVGMQEASGNNANCKRPMLETTVGTWSQIMERASVFGNAARARAILRTVPSACWPAITKPCGAPMCIPMMFFKRPGPSFVFCP